ncbi:MAG: TIGR04282 family arsenosugar biosynthesis glycosyltransferase [bacterium]
MLRKQNLVLLFAKYPEIGRVKTRLAKSIGDRDAVRVYEGLLSIVLSQCLVPRRNFDLILCFDPSDKERDFAHWLRAAGIHPDGLRPQSQSPLGERLDNAFRRGFQEGYGAVAAIGSDCLAVDRTRLEEAFEKLKNSQVCLGPTEDGGYYLIAMRSYRPSLFSAMPWSEPGLIKHTCEKLEREGVAYSLLAAERDVDDLNDLLALSPAIQKKMGYPRPPKE